MAEVKTAPEKYSIENDKVYVFLAGSIEMDKAEDWQNSLINKLKHVKNLVILNPRRKKWDSSWEQSISNPNFNEQVTWELDSITKADMVIIYFDPETKAPISLLELGILAKSKPDDTYVICNEPFYRKGNVDIVCKRYGVKQLKTLDDFVDVVKTKKAYDH
jgi:hypothetical protein